MLMQVVESIADGNGEGHGAIDGQLSLLVQNGAQQPAVDPLDDHVTAAAIFAVEGLDDSRMIDLLADRLFAPEALEKNRIGFHLRMRNLQCHRTARAQVGSAEERGHAAARNFGVQTVVVQRVPGFEFRHD